MPDLRSVRSIWAPLLLIIVAFLAVPASRSQALAASGESVLGVFVGTSPSDKSIRQLLQIPSQPAPEVIQWKLTLYHNEKTQAPGRYELSCDYGLTASGEPGLAKAIKSIQRQGAWARSKGTRSDPAATVIDLAGTLSLLHVNDNVLHVLNADRSLMTGDSGWSYSLNRTGHAEETIDPALTRSEPSVSYRLLPLATGPTVFGVFEGRSPCKGIASQLQMPVHAGCLKAKWRVTLFQNSETLEPTTYRVEGTLYRSGAREGTWTRGRSGQTQSGKKVYSLTLKGGGPALHLLEGDDNVLFFLDRNKQPLAGSVYFSYTLNRRAQLGRS